MYVVTFQAESARFQKHDILLKVQCLVSSAFWDRVSVLELNFFGGKLTAISNSNAGACGIFFSY
jgi:hypothetical protein